MYLLEWHNGFTDEPLLLLGLYDTEERLEESKEKYEAMAKNKVSPFEFQFRDEAHFIVTELQVNQDLEPFPANAVAAAAKE